MNMNCLDLEKVETNKIDSISEQADAYMNESN